MACPGAASVTRCVWLSSALAQQVASILDPLTSGALGMKPDTLSYHLELRNPVFWKTEGWKEELGLWGWGRPGSGSVGGLC